MHLKEIRQKTLSGLCFYWSLLSLLGSLSFFLVSSLAPPSDAECDQRNLVFSPLQEAISYRWVNYADYFFPRSVYRTRYNRPIPPDTEQAWRDLVHDFGVSIPEDTLGVLNQSTKHQWKRHPDGEMYSDRNGVASEHSEAVYQTKIRRLLFLTSLLAGVGFGASVVDVEYGNWDLFKNWFSSLRWSALCWTVLLLHSLWLHGMRDCAAVYTAGLRGSALSALTLASQILEGWSRTRVSFTISSTLLQYGTAFLLALIQTFFPRRPDVFTPEGKLVDRENGSSAFQKYSMQWCTHALYLAGDKVSIDQLPALDHYTRSKSHSAIVSLKTSLWNHLAFQHSAAFIKQWTLMLLRSVVTFGSPYCVMRLLKCLEMTESPTDEAWLWLIGIALSSVGEAVIHYHLAWIQWSELGIPIRAQLIMAIFQKALRIKDSKHAESLNSKAASEKAQAINLISSDTLAFSKFTAVNHVLPFSVVKFVMAISFLLRLLGWQSTLIAMVVTVASVPIHTMVIKHERKTRKDLTAARDRKIKVINEALQALRQIKLQGLEAQWEERINQFRLEELNYLRRTFMASTVRSVWKLTAPLLVAAASVCTFGSSASISPSIIFPMIELLPHLQGTLGTIPTVIQDLLDARSNAYRMDEYLRRLEQNRIIDPSPSGQVVFRNASLTWPTEELLDKGTSPELFCLRDINLKFPVGELSVIHGQTGSGKTLLLSAILGEADLLSGSIEAPSVAEGQQVAFVAQSPWLQNATVKDNILFGNPLDQERYIKVLNACMLPLDLAALPKGDETKIGLNGVKLSGGQRTRVALARAIYSSAVLLVLDDILSALDASVSRDILRALTGELCHNRTRILVTHRASLCAPMTKYVVQLHNNTISYTGSAESMEEVVALDPKLNVDFRPPIEPELLEKTRTPTKTKKAAARSDLRVYARYFTAAGGFTFGAAYLLGLVMKQLLAALTTWALGRINSASSSPIPVDLLTPVESSWHQKYTYLYLLSLLMTITWDLLFNLHTFSGSVRASEAIFREMTARVIRMPLMWLDTASIGEFADCIVKMIVIAVIGLYTSRNTTILTIGFLYAGLQVGRIYIKARSMVKRADAEPTAAILEHFATTSSGISTIRAFGAVGRFVDQMHHHLDRLSVARRYFWVFNRWLGLQMSLIGILFSTGMGVFLLFSNTDPSLVGFSLSFSMGLSGALFKAVNAFGLLETYMDAAGTVTAYSELQIEDQRGADVPEDWPSQGEIIVNKLEVGYSPNLPLVLKNISFTAVPGQRIGIVGRTGAGKSSLALALLRLIEPCSGSILVDGIDLSRVKVQSLRAKIAFVPQDPILFSGTVRSNLDYFQRASKDTLEDALRRVRLLAVGDSEGGRSGALTLDSPISAGGANISQGQRQLLCLARILVQDPKVVILDEATSAVDNETDRWIQETIQHELDRTLIVVAHRLRSIASFDQVLVISDGRIVEAGCPVDLLRRQGVFYKLVEDSGDKEFLIKTILG
ncbi:P-loop containing nucleoside triphosphate hydrolase protein [Aspergillus sergii]|uniref:P-loop containing nucleoside triphosphate hydrolase protein n=1 Tax=Aspergillus sergii TaxID=1034303 RepID=A0A5N6XEM5_9EURO|nr:P-loop containing nucleoside triphosphate hydrolase protein [Aspergillus sergii]